LLMKPNAIRGPFSGVYLPLPDKPLGVFHDIHLDGKMAYDPKLRVIDRNSGRPTGWKYNQGYLMRWVYPNMEISFGEAKIKELFDQFWKQIAAIKDDLSEAKKRDAKLTHIAWLYHSLENFHVFIDGNGRTNILVLDTLLSWVGLHPILFYNAMESALSSVDDMREKILEGYRRWEEAMDNIEKGEKPANGHHSSWTLEKIKVKNKECKAAIDALWGKAPPADDGSGSQATVPDTQGGCFCIDSSTCDTNEAFANEKWCFVNSDCTWKWDFCAPGRQKQDAGSSAATKPAQARSGSTGSSFQIDVPDTGQLFTK